MKNDDSETNCTEINRILFEKYQNGDLSVRNEIIKNNLAIVERIARTYSKRSDASYEDLFQEGCIALIKAIDKYDMSHDKNFGNYASLSIMGYIINYIRKNKYLIHIPSKLIDDIALYDKLKSQNLDDIEIREKMKMSLEEFNEFLNNYNKVKYIKLIDLKQTIYKDDEILKVEDTIEGNQNIDIAIDNVSKEELRAKLKELLTERELQVIYMRYGFDCNKMSRSQIGEYFSVPISRVKDIENKGLKKLREYNRTIMQRFW